jgi:hypothetical protein
VSPVKYELCCYIPEDDILHSHRRENLKYYKVFKVSNKCSNRCKPNVFNSNAYPPGPLQCNSFTRRTDRAKRLLLVYNLKGSVKEM